MPPVAGFFAGAFGWGIAGATATAWGGAWIAGAGFASTIVGSLTVKLLTSVAISALQMALAPSPSGGGLTITTTLRGENNPETIILGRYATSGQCVYVNSHGKSNRYLTHVVELCSAPGATLSRLMLGDKWVALGTTAHESYGLPVITDDGRDACRDRRSARGAAALWRCASVPGRSDRLLARHQCTRSRLNYRNPS